MGTDGLLVHNVNAGYYDRNDFIVYVRLGADGKPAYIGRTVGSLAYRYGSGASDYQVVVSGLTYKQARGLEQAGIEHIGLDTLKERGGNDRNGVDPKRKDDRAKSYRNSANRSKKKKKKLLDFLDKCK